MIYKHMIKILVDKTLQKDVQRVSECLNLGNVRDIKHACGNLAMAASYIGIGRLYYIALQIMNLKEVNAQFLGECYQLLIECCIEFLIASQEIIGKRIECKFE